MDDEYNHHKKIRDHIWKITPTWKTKWDETKPKPKDKENNKEDEKDENKEENPSNE